MIQCLCFLSYAPILFFYLIDKRKQGRQDFFFHFLADLCFCFSLFFPGFFCIFFCIIPGFFPASAAVDPVCQNIIFQPVHLIF